MYWASEKSGVHRDAFADAPCAEGSTCASFGSATSPTAVDAQLVYWTETAGTIKRSEGTSCGLAE